ncbi:class I SAM-dependent methyltransferase [Nocardia sp. NPDC004068]|uniref:class I SAM-dependent methyltransferase n=1 Tax=Nocardia sp. NPDC004068 TaxID=3364303 RepID=UPI003684BE8F
MRTSLVYRNRRIYELLMRGLYRTHYAARFTAIDELIPDGVRVLDVCCGPATLYTRCLRDRSIDYTGLDRNAGFVADLIAAGGHGRVWDVRDETPLPAADFVVMQASLYHFLPDAAPVVDRMRAAAGTAVIVTEPIRNLATSEHRVVAALARRCTDAGDGAQAHRFTETTLDALFDRYGSRVTRRARIAGGREKLYVLTP